MAGRAWTFVLVVATGLVTTVGTLAATAALTGSSSTASTISGKSITAVKVVRETALQTTTSTSWVDLPGATVTVNVPNSTQAVLLTRFSAESKCGSPVSGQTCSIRILVNGVEAEPASGTNFIFNNSNASAEHHGFPALPISYLAGSMDRSFGPVSPGAYTVKVQWVNVLLDGTEPIFEIDDWSLTVERVKA